MKNFTCLGRKLFYIAVLSTLTPLLTYSQQVAKGLTAPNGVYIGFYEYKPVTYNTNIKYPLIISLHGIGERGNGTTDLSRVLGLGIPRNIADGHTMTFTWNGKTETFLVLSPQLSGSYGDWQNFYIDAMIDYAKANMSVDTNRIFLTGLSLGGGGTWRYVTLPDYMGGGPDKAKKLAAIGVVCGTCQGGSTQWCNITNAKLPTWAWHANDDGTVGAGCTTNAISNINNCNPEVKPYMTLWPTGQHWIWGRVYATDYSAQHPNIYEWFLGQNKSKPVNKRPVANAGPDLATTTGSGSVTLNASGSSDQDGTLQRFVWTKIAGPNYGSISTPVSTNGVTTVTGLAIAGTYSYEVRVIDDRADWTLDTVNVVVTSGTAPVNQSPVANAGIDINITLPTNSTTLNGSSSYDPDGSIASYAWSWVSGPSQYTIANTGAASTSLTNLVAGTYTFKLTVTDNGGKTSEDLVILIVLPAIIPGNQAPVANAGNNITLTLPASSTTLNGSASADADGSIATYSWTRISGPSQYTIADAAAASTGLSNLAEGTYAFRLVVTDNGGLTDDDTVQVTVNPQPPASNQPPVPNAGADITITLPVNSATLDGSASYDPDGTLSAYEWQKLSGPAQYTIANANAKITTVSNLAQGTYTFKLRVWDNFWSPRDDTVRIIVNPAPNQPPVANAGSDISLTLPNNSTTLNGTGSTDPNGAGTITGYNWTKISGPSQYTIANAGAASTALSNLVQGTYSFRLLVTDNGGLTDADTVVVIVNPAPTPANQAPVANAGTDISITLPNNSTTLNGTGSTDPDGAGTITGYNWTKISGPSQYTIANQNAASTALSNLVQGTYSFRLLVTDNGGLTDADTVVVTVNPKPNVAPIANAGADIVITLPANSTTLNGTGSTDPDGASTITGYNWTKISGPSQYTIANQNAASTALSNLVQGTYSFRLLVTDNGGLTDADTMVVIVNPAPTPANQAPVANAGTDISITLPTSSTTLNGTGSTDPDGAGTITGYSWTKISGPSQYTIANQNAASTALSNLVQGTYSFRLLVTDNGGLTDADTVVVTVLPKPNDPPVAKAGNDQSVNLPNPVIQLDGTASYDPDGSIVSYSWVKINGAGAITIVNSTTATPAVVGVQAGEYIFELTVKDNNGASATDQVKINVLAASNSKPIADAGRDTGIAVPATTATLNGSGSYDIDGFIILYTWRQISGPVPATINNPNGVITNIRNLETGEYGFELTVSDNYGAISKDSVTISVYNNFRYEEKLTVFPNPTATTTINVRCISDSMGVTRINIYDGLGNFIQSFNTVKSQSHFETPITIAHLQKGMYYLEVTIENKKKMITKFIKR